MANYNLTNQTISSSFEQLLQKDTDTGNLVDGLGNPIDSLDIKGQVSSSFVGDGSGLTNLPTQTLPSGVVSGSSQISDITGSSLVTSSFASQTLTFTKGDSSTFDIVIPAGSGSVIPSGTVSGSSQIDYPLISNIPSGIVSSSDQLSLSGSDIYYNNQPSSLTSSNVQDAITELDMTKAPISALSSNLIVYPTTEPSSISGYFTLVASPEDNGYNTTAVNVPTGTISGSNQFIAALATTGSLFQGNPGVINITTVGNVRRTGGGTNSSADFYFEVYKRSGSVETLIATSNNTSPVNVETYEQFFATALLNNGTFTEDDVIVTKYYGSLIDPAGADPSFDFQFGGEEPIRTLIPVPASVITEPTLTLRVNNLEIFSASIQEEVDGLSSETASYAKTNVDNTFTGNQSFNDITVSGTGSFAHINYVTGSATIIGDAFVVLNADTPTQRYAGIKVFDSGSNTTASLQWDGDVDSWLVIDEQDNSAFLLSGPTGSLGGETTLTTDTILKSGVGNQVLDSNITDNGSTITLGSTTNISAGNLEFTDTNQVIFNPNGTLEISEVATTALLTDGIEPNNSPSINLNGNTIISGNLEMAPNTALISRVLDVVDEMATPLMLVDTIEPNNESSITFGGNVTISGSVATMVKPQGISSLTSSVDFNTTTMYELTLGQGVDTHLDATNVGSGQTINLLITQNGTTAGTVSFSPQFLQPSGSEYVASTDLGSQDILTLMTYNDTSKIYVASVNKFI